MATYPVEPDWQTIGWIVDRHLEAIYRQRPELKSADASTLRRAVAEVVFEDLRKPLVIGR